MITEKVIIFDASTLISISMNGLYPELKKLKEKFNGKFIITKEVKYEVIDRPIQIKRFELEALRLKELFDQKIIESPSSVGFSDAEISRKTQEILEISNKSFIGNGKEIHLIDLGEASCIALANIIGNKVDYLLAIDERTTRMLCENPENLRKLLEKKLHTKIIVKNQNFKLFKGLNIIRSTELIYVAYKKGIFEIKNNQLLDALLYGLKFKGASISDEEIEEIKKI